MESQAEIVNFAERRRAAKVTEELNFNNMEELLAFLAHEITKSKLKYSKLAERAHVVPQTVSRIAHGETRGPRAATVFSILAALGFEVVIRR
jgi:transcriptional regulator with XRE-family HTH domain